MSLAFAGLFLSVLVWWISIQPSHDRQWRPEVAVMPRAIIDGDRVRITGLRNFEYRSRDDFTVRYEEREVSLSHLTSVDFFVSYWKVGPVGHTFLSFIFDNAPPLSISIETRPEVGESYAPIASLFKQFELIYVHSFAGPVPGVTGHLAIHMQEPDDRKKVPEFHEVFIDIGVGSKAEAEKLVRVGDAVTMDANVLRLAGDRIAARACDNRIGTWSAAEALRHLAAERERLSASVVAVSTIQEENGLYGATMAGYRVRPDVALVVDVTHATDIPNCSKPKHGDVTLGGGPVISIGSANHPVLVERLRKIAAEKTIPIQFNVNPRFTGTDADAIFVQRGGIPTVCIGLPNRYMHSPVEVIDLADLEALAQLLAEFCLDLKGDDVFAVEV